MVHSQSEIDEWVSVEQKNLADRVSNSTYQLGFKKLPLEFRYGIKEKCPRLSEKAIKLLLPFPTTYLSEAGFSFYTSTKKQKTECRKKAAFIKSDIKDFTKIQNNATLRTQFF